LPVNTGSQGGFSIGSILVMTYSGIHDCKARDSRPSSGSSVITISENDSLSTHYSSLFDISSLEELPEDYVTTSRLRRRLKHRQELKSRESSPQPFQSKWVELANKRLGAFDKFMRLQNAMQIDTFGTHSGQFESEAFELMDPEERTFSSALKW
jgi:hypothetical protein